MSHVKFGLMTLDDNERVAATVLNNCGLELRKYRSFDGLWFDVIGAEEFRVLSTPKFKRVKEFSLALATDQAPRSVKTAVRRALAERRRKARFGR